ncbi:protein O-linked-mannose beta-1,4-N-acetylglucosaminyltransferase 2 [Eutrema salsugineum]|uniref:protein O-linked-mannose beta-1,4-N-acetylglucosaminyltransferase 2 n=1 Tax=Eutrema salsugineum TaxID=72664 RepID=UPI000CED06EA|nr:protein O-linked-mannose beta-1,4-N-acetylglucosaminyltransferase 2 [Eutrema salsugineum]
MVMKTMRKSYWVAAVALVIFLFMYLALFSSVFDLQLIRSLSLSQGTLQQTWESRLIKQAPQMMVSATITCYRSHTNYDVCSINGSCNLDPRTGTITLMDQTLATSAPIVEKIRPYPRKTDQWIMSKIKELTLTSDRLDLTRSCDITHDSPAIVFSAGGYTGNIYHDFIDGFIPLFITAKTVFPDRDFILVVVNHKKWWMPKYMDVLGAFSKHKTILLDEGNASITHCFTSAIVGLISHEPMTIDPTRIPNSKSLVDFHNFLDKAFNTNLSTLKLHKPRLILVSRYGNIGRVMLNEKEVKEMLEEVGFEVITFRPSKTTSLREAYKLVKSSHGMVGVHGAALTHLLFLRPGSVLVQIVPVGLGWVAKTCFESPAKAMKLEYVEYLVNVEESSLVEKYSRDDLVLKDPIAFRGMDWNSTKMNVYLKEQDVRLDVNRFREHMNQAYKKAKSFMCMNC